MKSNLLTVQASTTRSVNGNGSGVKIGGFARLLVILDITASATVAGDTLDIYIDIKVGTKWINAIHFAQQAGNGAAKTEYAVLDSTGPGAVSVLATSDAAAGVVRPAVFGSEIRARWVVVNSGGAQSHTFSVMAQAQE